MPTKSYRSPAVTLAVAIAGGICVSRAVPGLCSIFWLAGIVACGAWLLCAQRRWLRCSTLMLIAGWFALAAAWHDVCWTSLPPRDLSRVATDNGVSIRLRAKVIEPAWIVTNPEPAAFWRTPERTLIMVECRDFSDGEGLATASGRVRISLAGNAADLTCGDVISVVGKLRAPPEPLNPGDFDYRDWLKRQGVRAILHVEDREAIQPLFRQSQLVDVWGRFRQRLRERARKLFVSRLSPENASVAETLLLGGRRRLDDELRQAFVDSGMMHVLAISGVNVALLGLWLTILCRLAGRTTRQCLLLSVMGLIAYAAVTDGDPPVVRATIMAVMAACAAWLGRLTSVVQIVALTLIGMMLARPTDLFDTGAQLSFLSVLTISRTLAAWQARQQAKTPDERLVAESIWPHWLIQAGRLWRECSLVSLGIWLATTPLVAWRFQLISPVGLILNIVLGPLVVLLMWSGYSFLMVGMVSPWCAAPLGYCFDVCLWGLIRSVTWASAMNWGHLEIASPPNWWMAGYYLGVGVLLLWGSQGWIRTVMFRGLLVWTVIGLAAGLIPTPSTGVSCRFLAVGHGLSVLLELPNGRTVLYDAGSMGDPQRAARIVKQELRRRGLRRLDAVIISHADADHCNALPELLPSVSVGSVLIGPGFLNEGPPLPKQIVELCALHRVPVGLLSAGHQLPLHPDVTIQVLHPSEDFYAEKDNPLSLVTAVEYAGRRILLTGDVEGDGLTELLKHPRRPCDVLLSPHHGSRLANPQAFADWSSPEWVVISTQEPGAEARIAEAYPQALQVWATARQGAIEFQIDPRGQLQATSFRGGDRGQSVR